MTKVAQAVSKIGTSPIWVLIWTILFGTILKNEYGFSQYDYVGILILSTWTFGVAFFLKNRFDLDNKNRKYRTYFLSIFVIGWTLFSLIYWQKFSPHIQDSLKIALTIISIVLINNVFYRISFHVALSTSLLILINHFTGWDFFLLFIIIPVIAWSRVYLRKHTLAQVILGFLVPVIVYSFLKIIELIS